MKKILVACAHPQFDVALDRCVAHLRKSCLVETAHDSDAAFDRISCHTFDLIIIDYRLPGTAGSLELVESMPYIDPDVSVMLMLLPEDKACWHRSRNPKTHSIQRPFKPIKFLRLVDKLLHKQLVRYRQLALTLSMKLELLCAQTGAIYAFLVDNSGQILVASSKISAELLEPLGNLAVGYTALDEQFKRLLVRDKAIRLHHQASNDYGLHVAPVLDSLYLGLLVPLNDELANSSSFWEAVETTVLDTIVAFYGSNGGPAAPADQPNHWPQGDTLGVLSTERSFIPVKIDQDDDVGAACHADADDSSTFINWQILSGVTGPETQDGNLENMEEEAQINWGFMANGALLKRLGTYCRIG